MTREQIEARLAELQEQATHFASEMQNAQLAIISVKARIAECELWLEQTPAETKTEVDQAEGWSLHGAKP